MPVGLAVEANAECQRVDRDQDHDEVVEPAADSDLEERFATWVVGFSFLQQGLQIRDELLDRLPLLLLVRHKQRRPITLSTHTHAITTQHNACTKQQHKCTDRHSK